VREVEDRVYIYIYIYIYIYRKREDSCRRSSINWLKPGLVAGSKTSSRRTTTERAFRVVYAATVVEDLL
jgi:hypothetical protein